MAYLAGGCGGEDRGSAGIDEQALGLSPDRLTHLKAEVVRIAEANTTRQDNVAEVRAQLLPMIEELADAFAADRPGDEPALLRGTWKSIWYDDADLDGGLGFLQLQRDTIYQVVEEGYYYNVAESKLLWGGRPVATVHSFLKGEYAIANPADEAPAPARRLNVIDLEFTDNRLKLGKITTSRPLSEEVERVEQRRTLTFPVPGPIGVTGELWNLYLDDGLRIAAGIRDDEPDTLDLYILRRTIFAGPLPPYAG